MSKNTINKLNKYYTIAAYADACGIGVSAVKYRIKNGLLATTTVSAFGETSELIDITVYPITRLRG